MFAHTHEKCKHNKNGKCEIYGIYVNVINYRCGEYEVQDGKELLELQEIHDL